LGRWPTRAVLLISKPSSIRKALNITFEGKTTGCGSEKPKTSRAKVAPVYRDPENPENTWTGRGRKPRWLVAALEAGKSIEEYKI